MKYDPIKKMLGSIFNQSPYSRIVFYKILDLILLRSWHIHSELRKWFKLVRFKADIRILDAGFGFGQYSYFISQKLSHAKITGIDVKEDQVKECTEFFDALNKRNVRFETGDLVIYNEPAGFDMILCVDVMEHIEEDVQVFKNYYTSLKPDGVLFISTPSDQGGSDVHEDEDESFIGEHVRDGYGISDMEQKLKIAGFNKIECKYSYGRYGSISWRLSMKYPILMLNRSRAFIVLLPFYYLVVFPISLLLNKLDVVIPNKVGTGLIVKAMK